MNNIELLQFVLTSIGAPTLIYFLITTFVNRYHTKKDKKAETKDDLLNRVEKLEKANKAILKELQEKEELLKAVDIAMLISNSALMAILRNDIIQTYNVHIEKQYMPIHDRDSLDSMYKEYKNLGGNGVVKELIEKLHTLPTSPPNVNT